MTGVKIIQADRDSAASFMRGQSLVTKMEMMGIIEGQWDSEDAVQAFAAHRRQAVAELVQILEDAEIDFISGLTMPTKESREQCLKRGLTAVRGALAQYREDSHP